MALSIAKTRSGVIGDLRYVTGTVTFDSSYPTGGEAITAEDLGLSSILHIAVNPAAAVGTDVKWDSAASKLLIYKEDGTSGISAQVANASDQSAVAAQVFVLGY